MNYQDWKQEFQKLIEELYSPSDSASFDEAFQEQRIINMKCAYPQHWERWKSERKNKQ